MGQAHSIKSCRTHSVTHEDGSKAKAPTKPKHVRTNPNVGISVVWNTEFFLTFLYIKVFCVIGLCLPLTREHFNGVDLCNVSMFPLIKVPSDFIVISSFIDFILLLISLFLILPVLSPLCLLLLISHFNILCFALCVFVFPLDKASFSGLNAYF